MNIGDEVICIDATNTHRKGLKELEHKAIYTVDSFWACKCTANVSLKGIETQPGEDHTQCSTCGERMGGRWFRIARFRKLETDLIEQALELVNEFSR